VTETVEFPDALRQTDGWVDVLMITHRRPDYVRLSLPALLESADERTRVWLWHNGDDAETLATVKSFSAHPAVHNFHHSPTNAGIRPPTNWAWLNSTGQFVSKVDDDCIVDRHWISELRQVHAASPEIGVVGTWRFYDEDFDPAAAMRKVQRLPNGERIMRNHWVQGSGYLAKRRVVQDIGAIRDDESFPDWCLRAAKAGYKNGWKFPFVGEEHMDDPRSPHTMFVDEDAFTEYRPLHAQLAGLHNLSDWTLEQHREALIVQRAPIYLYDYHKPGVRIAKLLAKASREPGTTAAKTISSIARALNRLRNK
jgi:glycosyltransferase involved in cell wall biosynthesis